MTTTDGTRHPSPRRKANRMTEHTTALPADRPRIADRARAAARKLSDRLHAAGDDHARAHGWHITQTPGPLGLTGRRYHDPRFATHRQTRQHAATRKRGAS